MPNPDLTVIYYTHNLEKSIFEDRIRQTLSNTIGDLPLISVSQRPIRFGKNICVGEIGPSYQNAFRQMQVGAIEAKTKFICTAESDMIYPKEYFEFVPPTKNKYYMAMPLYVLFAQRHKARVFSKKPRGSESAMVCSRDLFIEGIEKLLKPRGTMWSPPYETGEGLSFLLKDRSLRKYFITSIPTITIKTDENMHRKTPHDTVNYLRELAPFGTAKQLLERYMA